MSEQSYKIYLHEEGVNMIKKIVMENLICTGCTAKIEKALAELPYIQSASFNMANQTMLIDVTEDYPENAIHEIRKIVNSIETGVFTYPYEKRHLTIHKSFFRLNWLIFAGIGIFLLGRILENLFNLVVSNPFYWIGYFMIAHKIGLKTLKGMRRKDFFNENTLMMIATLAAMAVGHPYEAMLVILFYSVGEHLQHKAVHQSKQEISSLIDLHIEYANILDEDGNWIIKDPASIKKNDRILVKNGEKIPVDGIIEAGRTSLNTSALTGESKPQSVKEGDYVLSGNINVGNVIEMRAAKEYQESTIARIIDLIENATNKKSRTEAFITRFAKYYTPVVTILAIFMFAIPSYFDPANMDDYILRAATFLVISCPCALVLSVPLSYYAGIGSSARKGILFKGSNFLDMMHEVDVIGIDKTGTLTHGNFIVDGYTNLQTLGLAASLEKYSNHPIAQSIVDTYQGSYTEVESVEEIPGYGLKAMGPNGEVLVGSRKLLKKSNISVTDERDTAGSNVFVSENGSYIGRIVVKDQIKDSAKTVLRKLMRKHRIVMLTGDNQDTASEVAYEIGGIDYKHSLLPEDKIIEFENLKSKKRKMYVGDGINDAPLLKTADIGVAMGNGSELAIDVADVIIMDDDIETLQKAFKISHKTRSIVYQNIILSLGVKFSFLVLASLGMATMLMAIFADVGITLIAVANALRLIYGKRAKTL